MMTGIEIDEDPHSFCFLVSEPEGPYRARDAAKVGPSQTFLPGMVLGSVGTPASMTVSATPDADNTGNGTITMDATAPIASSAKDGAYRVLFTSATAFIVTDPSGKEEGKGVVGTAFAKDVKFVIAAGATAFAADDAFTVQVGREALTDEMFVAWNPAATDGSQIAKAIACHKVITAAAPAAPAVYVPAVTAIFDGSGEVRGSDLIWATGASAAQLAEGAQQLRSVGIKIR